MTYHPHVFFLLNGPSFGTGCGVGYFALYLTAANQSSRKNWKGSTNETQPFYIYILLISLGFFGWWLFGVVPKKIETQQFQPINFGGFNQKPLSGIA